MAFFTKKTNLNEPDYPELAASLNDKTVERGTVSIETSQQSKSKVQKLILTAGIFTALVMVIFAYLSLSSKKDTAPPAKVQEITPNANKANFSREMDEMMRNQPKPVAQDQDQAPTTQTPESPGQAMATPIPEAPAEPDLDLERRLKGSVLIGTDAKPSSANQSAERQNAGRETTLGNRLTSRTPTPAASAHKRGDLTYLLRKGTNISCTLNTKIVTTHPGFTRCLVSKDVYSANGKVLLIERGSEIIGEQTTAMLQGQARVFVLWNTVETPNGVTLDIDSPSADSLGASGQTAQVDTHFWERFGGAIMLSLIDDGLVILGDRVNKSRSNVSYDSTSDTISSMSAEALKNTINIPPTGYVNQGTLVNVMVARDVDFNDVYELVEPYLIESGGHYIN